jgi:Ca2+-transporting ATPase
MFMKRQGIILTPEMMENPLFARATAITYLTIAYCQFVNILSRRDDEKSLFNKAFFSNKILLGSIVWSITMVFIGIYTPYVSDFLRFEGPQISDWIFILGASGIYLAVYETMKLFRRLRMAKA